MAHFINDYFINVGNVQLPGSAQDSEAEGPLSQKRDPNSDLMNGEGDKFSFSRVHEVDIYRIVKEINVSKSSGLDNISSFIIK